MATDSSTITTAARKARLQSAVVECREVGIRVFEWWAMLPDGQITVSDTADAALRDIQKQARKGNRGLTITSIEWRGVPDGFKPPTGVR